MLFAQGGQHSSGNLQGPLLEDGLAEGGLPR